MPKGETIRLVVWDLDETFWKGTLSEGGIVAYIQAHHDIVVELARRGIVSSICSKNDINAVEPILRERGLWEYFVFPSIDWGAKGPRLKQLIDDVQLRAESVLFIDDNASNRAEAAQHISGLQIADETVIADLLAHPGLQGKPDHGLTRLKQYQLLQRRKTDAHMAGSDQKKFLRNSKIHALIDPDIESNIDRAIELINRTNQLNFIKTRLPEDRDAAAAALLKLTRQYCNQAGLIRVWDQYGDHGYCGFYLVQSLHGQQQLLQFCFSCRILGMGVEQWLYQKLGRPEVRIHGEVMSSLDEDTVVDWINQDMEGALVFAEGFASEPPPSFAGQGQSMLAPEIRVRGSCELDAVSHYLRQETPKLVELTSYRVGAFMIRRDEFTNLALFGSGMSDEVKAEVDRFGLFNRDDNDLDLFRDVAPGTLYVLTGWSEVYMPAYRHQRLGFTIHVNIWGAYRRRPEFMNSDIPDAKRGVWILTAATDQQIADYFAQYEIDPSLRTQVQAIVELLRADYDCIGTLSELAMTRDLTKVLKRIPPNCPTAILLPHFAMTELEDRALLVHSAVHGATARFPHVFTVDPSGYVTNRDLQDSPDHLDRMVYFRIYRELVARFAERTINLTAAE